MRGRMRWLGVFIWCLCPLAAIAAGWEAPAAAGAARTVPARGRLLGERAFPSGGQSAPVSRSIPLRVIEPVAYARQKREARERSKANATGASGNISYHAAYAGVLPWQAARVPSCSTVPLPSPSKPTQCPEKLDGEPAQSI